MTLDLSTFKPTPDTLGDAGKISSAFTAIETEANANEALIAALQTQGAVLLTKGSQPRIGQGRAMNTPSEYDEMLYGEALSFRGSFDRAPSGSEPVYTPWPSNLVAGSLSSLAITNLSSIPNARGNYAGVFKAGDATGGSVRYEVGFGSLIDAAVTQDGSFNPVDVTPLFRGNSGLADRVGDDRWWGYKIRVPSVGFTALSGGTLTAFQSSPVLAAGASGAGLALYLSDYPNNKTLNLVWQGGKTSDPAFDGTSGFVNTTTNAVPGWTLPQDTWVDVRFHIVYRTNYGTGGGIEIFVREEGGGWVTGFSTFTTYPTLGGVPTMKTDGSEELNTGQFHKVHSGLYIASGAAAGILYGPLYMTGYCRGADGQSVDDFLAGRTLTKKWHPGRRYDREVMRLGPNYDFEAAYAGQIVSGLTRWDNAFVLGSETVAYGASAPYTIGADATTSGSTLSRRPVKHVNTAGGAFTIKLNSNANAGDRFLFVDIGGALATNNLTIDRNGSTIEGATQNITLKDNGASIELYYTGATWKIVASSHPQVFTATPSNPSSTTSTTPKMMGLAGAITPRRTGRLRITITGVCSNDTAGDGAQVQGYYGTGTAPTNGAAPAGTVFSSLVGYKRFSNGGDYVGFTCYGEVEGLTNGTAVWIDAGVNAVTAGSASISQLKIVAEEI